MPHADKAHTVQYKGCTACRLALEAEWWVLGDNWESSVLFFVVFYQYITCALIYSFGSSFRLGLFYNWAVTVSITLAHPAALASLPAYKQPWRALQYCGALFGSSSCCTAGLTLYCWPTKK